MSTTSISCAGSWTDGTANTISAGSSLVTFTGTATVTSAGKSFYDITFNNAASTFTIADPLSCHNLTTTTMTAYTNTGTTITSSGNVTFNGAGTLNLGIGITLTGNGSLTLNPTLGSGVTSVNCNVVLQGTGSFSFLTTTSINNLSIAFPGKITTMIGNGNSINLIGGVLTLNGGTMTVSSLFGINLTTQTAPIVMASPTTINGTTNFQVRGNNTANLTYSLPSITVSGSANFSVNKTTGAGNLVVNFTGNQSWGLTGGGQYGSVGTLTINTNNYAISWTSSFIYGSDNSASKFIYNFGSSIVTIPAWALETTNKYMTLNMQTSQWNVSGSWAFTSFQTVTHQLDSVTFTNTATITSNTKSFYNLIINAPTKTITLADNTTINSGGSFTLTAGTISAGTTYIVFSGSSSITLSANLSSRIQTKVAGSTITWNTGANTWTIPAYAVNDIGGSLGNLVLWRSSTPTTAYKVSFPSSVTLSYTDLQDCNNTGTTVIADTTCVNSLRNTNFTFNTNVSQSISPINISSSNQTVTVTIFTTDVSVTINNVPISLVSQINNPIFLSSFLENLTPINLSISNASISFQLSALNNIGPINISILNKNTDLFASVLENLSSLNLTAFVNGPIPSIPFIMNNEAIELFFDVILPRIQTTLFSDYAENYNSMGNSTNIGTTWISKSSPLYNQERRLFSNILTEAYNMRGITLDYYITSYDTSYDSIFGEDNNRRFIRTFKFRGFYTLPKEEKLWSKFGIEGLDQFSIYVSKLHFRDNSQNYIPRIGDILIANYNKYIYEIVDVKEESAQYLLSKQHSWEFIVKQFKDERVQTTAATSGTYIQDYTNKSNDIFDIKVPVETKNEEIKYVPRRIEKPSNDPFNGWN
jgi:hypothetical protein